MRTDVFNRLYEIKKVLENNGLIVERIDDINNDDNKYQFVCEALDLSVTENTVNVSNAITDIKPIFDQMTYSRYGLFITVRLKDKT